MSIGYTSNTLNFIKHCSQFADDTAIIAALESDNQYLFICLQNGTVDKI